jgi:integrase
MARGSIQRRGDSWSAIVDLPPDPATGKRRQKRVTAATKREVERKVAELLASYDKGYVDAGRVTVREYLFHWLETTMPTIRPGTLRRYRELIRLHIVPSLGNVNLAKLTPADVQRLYADRLAVLSPATVRCIHSVLHHALDDAVKWGLLVRNVCDAVETPRNQRKEMATWSLEEVVRVLDAAVDDPFEAFWHVAIFTGMRRGEVLGLKWTDLDLDAGILSVRRTLSRGETSRLLETEPKTQAGRRRIKLSPSTIEVLKRHKVRQLEHRLAVGEAYEDRGYVFANLTGGHIDPNALYRAYDALIERAGVPRIRLHDNRHTSATLLLAGGIHPKIVQERLGHSAIAMTLDLYSHVTPDMQQQAADAMEATIANARQRIA